MSARNLGIKRRGGQWFKKSNGGGEGEQSHLGPDGLNGQDRTGQNRTVDGPETARARPGMDGEGKEQWQ